MDKSSISVTVGVVRCFDVQIRFSKERERMVYDADCGGWVVRNGGRVIDDGGDLYMVIELRVDDGERVRRGKAWGKLMREGVKDGAVVMTLEEGLRLGCQMEVLTMEEKSERIKDRLRLWKLQRDLAAVSTVFEICFLFCLGVLFLCGFEWNRF